MSKNGEVKDSQVPEDVGITATPVDFEELMRVNPGLQLPLVNIIQRRLLVEKDAEIARLKGD